MRKASLNSGISRDLKLTDEDDDVNDNDDDYGFYETFLSSHELRIESK